MTAKTVGVQIVDDSADKQAAVFVAMADEMKLWSPRDSWPSQCLSIATKMTEEQRNSVKTMFTTLCEHL